jgi:hypothetical protein
MTHEGVVKFLEVSGEVLRRELAHENLQPRNLDDQQRRMHCNLKGERLQFMAHLRTDLAQQLSANASEGYSDIEEILRKTYFLAASMWMQQLLSLEELTEGGIIL